MKTVLVLARSSDIEEIRPVMVGVRSLGGRCVVLETDRAVGRFGLAWSGPGKGHLDVPDQGRVQLGDLDAVWLRRTHLEAPDLPSSIRHQALAETEALLFGILADSPAFFVDPLPVRVRAGVPSLVHQVGRDAGLPHVLSPTRPLFATVTGTHLAAYGPGSDGLEPVALERADAARILRLADGLHLHRVTFQLDRGQGSLALVGVVDTPLDRPSAERDAPRLAELLLAGPVREVPPALGGCRP